MYQQSLEESIDFILSYNLHYFPKRRLYQYLHQIALATNKTVAVEWCLNAVSELSPSNDAEHAIPQHVENEILGGINDVLEKFISRRIEDKSILANATRWDSAATCFNELKESLLTDDGACLDVLVFCALATDNVEVLNFALKENYNTEHLLHAKDNETALHLAAYRDDVEIVKALLAAGADANAKDKKGKTPLMWAAELGHAEIFKALLAAGADANAKNNYGWTALMWAYNAEIVKALLAAGADANAKDKEGMTPLMRTADRGRVIRGQAESVKALLAAGADANAKDKEGKTPLMWAKDAEIESVKALLAAGADANAKDKEGRTPLMMAENAEYVKALLAAGADANAKNKSGEMPLMWAHNAEIVKALLAVGADINAKDKYGDTPLMWAAYRDDAESVKALLAANADWRLTNRLGYTAERIASDKDYKEVVRILSDLRKKAEAGAAFWENSYSVINYGIALVFITWVFLSISVKSDVEGSAGDIMLYIIGCLIPLVIKTRLSTKAEDMPRSKGKCIMYGITDFFCAMGLCLPAISNKTLGDDISGFAIMGMIVQLAIAILMYKIAFKELFQPSARTISIWNVLIAITLFYLGGGVMTDSYNFFENIVAALTLGY